MPRRKTTDEFIVDALKVHGHRYDYSLVEYKNSATKVKIVCKEHGVFEQQPNEHSSTGSGCPSCAGKKPYTTDTFIEKARGIHGDKFDYSETEYKGLADKVKFICQKHGSFLQTPANHLRHNGCPDCSPTAKLTTEGFVKRARKVHGDKYDYSKVEYSSSGDRVKIICNEHGIFKQTPNNHLNGQCCPLCTGKIKYTNTTFINKARETHGLRFDYSLVDYLNIYTKVKIICREHGVFKQTPKAHLKGDGCSKCGGVWKKDTPAFIKEATEVHKGIYDYTLTEYRGNKVKVIIFCKTHGPFKQTPFSHLQGGSGCPKCFSSKGEKALKTVLDKLTVLYQTQKTFDGCRDKKALRFDFFIPSHRLLIEYDGRQHFHPIKAFGGEEALKATQKRDKIKTEFARENNYRLLRIKYADYDRINEILTKALKGQTLETEQ